MAARLIEEARILPGRERALGAAGVCAQASRAPGIEKNGPGWLFLHLVSVGH
jgi:hypothetical protein